MYKIFRLKQAVKGLTAIFGISFILLGLRAEAQQNELHQVQFKNGQRIKGWFHSLDSSGNATFLNQPSDTLYFNISEVRSFTVVPVEPLVEVIPVPVRVIQPNDSGLFCMMATSLYFGSGRYASVISGAFHVSLNYWFRNRFAAGIGTGLEGFTAAHVPFFANLQYHPGRQKTSAPFCFTRMGYGAALSSPWLDEKGGVLAEAGIGIKKYIASDFGYAFSTSYRYQRTRSIRHYEFGSDVLITSYNRVGFSFQLFF